MQYYQHLADLALEKSKEAQTKIFFAYEMCYRENLITVEQYAAIKERYTEIKDKYAIVGKTCDKVFHDSALAENNNTKYVLTKEEQLLVAEAMNLISV